MPTPIGPLFAAGNQVVTKSGHRISYWPDAHNQLLQAARQAPIYYWLPEHINLAQKDNGDYKFSMIHFVGVRSSTTTVGESSANNEVAGGLLTFSTVAAPPDAVLAEAHAALIDQVRNNGNPLWAYTSSVAPQFTFVPIVDNNCTLSNTLPGGDGVPAGTPSKGLNRGAPPLVGTVRSLSPVAQMPRTVPVSYRGTNIDPMYVRMDGQGKGTIDPGAEKAFSALLGSIPAAIVYNGFHMGTSPLFVTENMMIRVVSPMMTIDITGDWNKIQRHFSAAAHAGGLIWGADVKVQFDSLRESGDIEVHTFIDTSLPGAQQLQEYMDKRADLIFNKFMDAAKQVIFDPAPFNEQPAEANSGLLGGVFGGFGGALKVRQQETNLHLEYHETKEMAYLQSYQVNGTMDGVGDAIRADASKEKVYFMNLDLGDWDRKVTRIVKPVVNWPDPAQKWIGEPVAFLSVQTGYPNAQGVLQWDGHVFNPLDGPGAQWNTAVAMKQKSDVANPPAGWEPDKLFLKRQIHFTEPPSELENPFVRVQVEKNVVDLDDGELGSLDNTITVELRVDQVGTLAVGPLLLGAQLTDDSQMVEVTLKALGKRDDGKDRDPVKFTFKNGDQNEPRLWLLYTGQKDFIPQFQYDVRVVVKGTLFTHGQEWSTTRPIVTGGSGGLVVTVPTPDDPNVTTRALPLSAFESATTATPPRPVNAPPATGPVYAPAPPPATGGRVSQPTPTANRPAGAPPPKSLNYQGWSVAATPTGSREMLTAGPANESGDVVFSGFEPAARG
jgi:hypothetical protein